MGTPRLTNHRAVAAVAVLAVVAAVLAMCTSARAGTWTQVTCTQPSGQPAPTDGWSSGQWAGTLASGSGDVDNCAAGGALTAVSSTDGQPLSYTGPEWIYTAPAGSTIAGGSVTATLTSPQGQAWIGTPNPSYDGADVIGNCQLGLPCGTTGSDAATFAITHPGGTQIFAPALCVDSTAPVCPLIGGGAVNAEVDIKAADVALDVDATPTATGFSGPLLSRPARGVAALLMHASDPAAGGGFGPGVYLVTLTIDGTTEYSGVPDDNHGNCVSLGTDPTTGGMLFDHARPCASTASIDIPIDTSALADGAHHLVVDVGDAAGDSATVLDRTIHTFNPVLTPRPRGGGVATRLLVGFARQGAATRLDSIVARQLPRSAHVAVRCLGARCPRIRPVQVTASHVTRLWHALERARFTAGQRVRISITAPHRRGERLQLRIRVGHPPAMRVL